MSQYMKLSLTALLAIVLFGAGIAVFAAGDDGSADSSAHIYESVEDVVLSDEVKELIRAADPSNYARHIANYKRLLVDLKVSLSLKEGIEDLLRDGYKLSEALIGYEYLYHQFGTMQDLQEMLDDQQSGDAWENIFAAYAKNHVFNPRSFESGQLERWMSMPKLSADDIMIADRFSSVTGQPVEEVIENKLSVPHWYEITSRSGVLFSADELPRVQITEEQLTKFAGETGWTDDRVTIAFVVANQVGQQPAAVIDQFMDGKSNEDVFAAAYEAKHR